MTTPSVPSHSDYQRYLKKRSNAGNWFAFFRDYLKVMSRDAALFIQSVLNIGKENDEWIRCSVKFIRKTLYMSRETQSRVLGELQRKKFADTKRQGYPSRRYISIDLIAIEKAIDAKSQLTGNHAQRENKLSNGRKSRSAGKQADWTKNNGISKENLSELDFPLSGETYHNKEERNIQRRGTPPTSKCSETAKAAHVQLRSALLRNNRITGNRPGPVQAFHRLENKGIEYQDRLNWFCNHCSKEDQAKLGLPTVIDGIDFCAPKVFSWIGDCQAKQEKIEKNSVTIHGKEYRKTGKSNAGNPIYERNGEMLAYSAREDGFYKVTE